MPRCITHVFVLLVGVTCALPYARATIINGDFEDGLNGWSIESGTFVAAPDLTGNHFAVSSQGGRLRQVFDLPPGAQTLTFRYLYHQSGPGGGCCPFDFLNFYLLDPLTFDNLIPPAPGFELAALFLGQDHTGVYAANPDFVSVTGPDDDGLRYVNVHLAHLPSQQNVYLEFGSFEFDDGRDSLLAIDDVVVSVPDARAGLAIAILALLVTRRLPRREATVPQ